MAQGLTRAEIGVTDAMIESYGELIFRLSNNHQHRRGDPIRLRDFTAIAEQKPALGLSDAEIAAKIGLSLHQVLFIRTLMEHRRFRTGYYQRLNKLGGGKRWRPDRHGADVQRNAFSDSALRLRNALTFPPERVRAYVNAGWWGNDTLIGWLSARAAENPDAPAIIDAEGKLNYGDLLKSVQTLAAGLLAMGLRRGDVVAMQLPNDRRFLTAYLAVTALGAVVTTIYLPHRRADFQTLLAHSRARAFIGLGAIGDFSPLQTVRDLSDTLPELAFAIAADDSRLEDSAGLQMTSLSALMQPTDEEVVLPKIQAADPFLLLYTSGTTAAPKGVPHNYHTLLSNARAGKEAHGLSAEDRLLSAAPFGHLFALYSVHLNLAAGASAVLLPQFSPPSLAQAVAAHRPSVLFTAPAHMAAARQAGLIDPEAWASLRLIILSGSAVPAALADDLQALLPGAVVAQLWGMTETQAGLYTRPEDAIDIARRCAGRPSPGTEVRIIAADEAPAPLGQEGELQVRGPLLFPGYLDNADANTAAFTADGWFHSGDLAVLDGDGNVTITGRVKDVINRGGVKFNPADIEDLLTRHPDIQQAAIIAMPDPVLGERACLVYIPAGERELSLQDVQVFLQVEGIGKQKWPEAVHAVPDMPLTPTRKVIKGRLQHLLSEQTD